MTKNETSHLLKSLPEYLREAFLLITFCLSFIALPLILCSGQGGLALLVVPLAAFCLVPVADWSSGKNTLNPTQDAKKRLRKNLCYRFITWLWVPIQLGIIAYGILWVLQPCRTVLDIAGMIFAVGIINGALGITYAHELIHKASRFEKALAIVLMTSVSYTHYCIEHVYGHHKNVATAEDPTTARFGENFYAFYCRSVSGQLLSAWHIEKRRTAKKPLQNRMLWHGLILATVYCLIYAVAGWLGLCFFILQGVVAFTILESTHYIEHYGLLRKEVKGVYERQQLQHSWNECHIVACGFLLNLLRHSAHHGVASDPFQVLDYYDNVPQLPFGYGVMNMMAMVPPLWFKVMNPLVLQWRPDLREKMIINFVSK